MTVRKNGKYTIAIGIIGTDRHVGVTHLCIMLANYLASKEHCRVAVVDMSKGNAIAVLRDIYQEEVFVKEGKCKLNADFQIHKVDYYTQVRQEDIANLCQKGYEYVVMDFGKVCLQNRNQEILRCHIRIMVGSCCEWQQHAYIESMEEKKALDDSGKWKYAAFLGIKEIRQNIEKRYRIKIHKIPYEEDPFRLHREHFELLRNMLQEE